MKISKIGDFCFSFIPQTSLMIEPLYIWTHALSIMREMTFSLSWNPNQWAGYMSDGVNQKETEDNQEDY